MTELKMEDAKKISLGIMEIFKISAEKFNLKGPGQFQAMIMSVCTMLNGATIASSGSIEREEQLLILTNEMTREYVEQTRITGGEK